jgi:dipeptidyl aminopeptidase/acylaminoacyl peptidase
LVVHGRNDQHVPIVQSDQVVNRLRSRNAEVWYLQAKDEGHTFVKQSNRVAYYTTVALFLKSLH